MTVTIAIAVSLIILVALLFAGLLRRLTAHSMHSHVDLEWVANFSVAKYRPMERLLSESDYRFLAVHKGYDRKIEKRLRSERRKILRGYLRCLKDDFSRLEAALRLFVSHSPVDRSDLAKALLKQRALFTFGVLMLECRLALHFLGVGTVNSQGLIGSLDSLKAQVEQLVLAEQFAAV
jgi:hypothetical protein